MVGVQLHRLLCLLLILMHPRKSVVPLLVFLLDNLLLVAVLAVQKVIASPIFSSVVGALR